MAARYRPAGRAQFVGGDWYDAYLDAAGTTSLVIGDVAGHDIEAAAAMGQLRTMLRMAGLDAVRTADEVLATVDRACATFGFEVFGGNAAENWLILKNGDHIIGLDNERPDAGGWR